MRAAISALTLLSGCSFFLGEDNGSQTDRDASVIDSPLPDAPSIPCMGDDPDLACDSGVCNRRVGTCVPEAQIVYVDAMRGTDNEVCSSSLPCDTIQAGLLLASQGQVRRTVYVAPGAYFESVTFSQLTIADPMRLLGFGATMNSLSLGQGVFLEIQGLEVTNSGGNGIEVAAQVELFAVNVHNNAGIGVVAQRLSGGAPTLIVESSKIVNNRGHGIQAVEAALIMRSAIVADNDGHGLQLFEGFALLDLNTIVNNGMLGIDCAGGAGGDLTGSIIDGNAASVPGPGCDSFVSDFSYVEDVPLMTSLAAPVFADAGNGDYRLIQTSPGIDFVPVDENTSTYDVELTPRGIEDQLVNIGAHEEITPAGGQ